MPQFDKITFFNQIFWLFFFFSGFYLIFLKIFLPKLSSVLKARVKKLQKGVEGVSIFSKEQEDVTYSFNNLIENITFVVKSYIVTSNDTMSIWLNSIVKTLNTKNLNSSNVGIETSFHKQISASMFCDRFFNSKKYTIKFLYFANNYNNTSLVDQNSY